MEKFSTLRDLPYYCKALVSYISEDQLTIHCTKHHRFREGMDITAAMIGESLPDIEPVEIEGKDPVTVSWELLEN